MRRDVHETFNRELQRRMADTVFAAGCPGWYTTDSGKVTQVWVGSHVEYGHRTAHFDPRDFEHGPPGVVARDGAVAGAGATLPAR